LTVCRPMCQQVVESSSQHDLMWRQPSKLASHSACLLDRSAVKIQMSSDPSPPLACILESPLHHWLCRQRLASEVHVGATPTPYAAVRRQDRPRNQTPRLATAGQCPAVGTPLLQNIHSQPRQRQHSGLHLWMARSYTRSCTMPPPQTQAHASAHDSSQNSCECGVEHGHIGRGTHW